MTETTSLQGLVASREDEQALLAALEQAFDYRGDVTITLADNTVIEGYLFDRKKGDTLATSHIRIMPPGEPSDPPEKLTISFADIASLEFTGKDMAHGKSFETWVKKFTEKKLTEAREKGYIKD